MNVLVACEYSGVVRDAFIALGHNALSCDLLSTDVVGPHYQGDARDLFNQHWDLMIAHPPCTRLCNSGVRWLAERDLWDDMRQAAELFNDFLNAPISMIAVENPVMHKYAVDIIGRKADFYIQPWEHGHGETKRTGFWTKNLPPLLPTNIVSGRDHRIHKMTPSPDRWKFRSSTYPGIAKAIAQQWGSL